MTNDRAPIFTPRLIIGLGLALLGVLFLLENAGIYDFDRLRDYWPVFLILVGLALFRTCRSPMERVFPILVTGLGGWLLLNNLGVVEARPWDYVVPLAVIAVGVALVASAGRRRRGTGEGSGQEVSSFSLLSGTERRVNAPDFRRADLTAILGGGVLDLRQAGLEGQEAVVDAFALWGGLEIKVPPDWRIEPQISVFLGGVDDSTLQKPAGLGTPTLRLEGMVIMGGVQITN